jgi:hypothetical protein
VVLPAEKVRDRVNRGVIFCAAGVLSASPLAYCCAAMTVTSCVPATRGKAAHATWTRLKIEKFLTTWRGGNQPKMSITLGSILPAIDGDEIFRRFDLAAIANEPPRLNSTVVTQRHFASELAD